MWISAASAADRRTALGQWKKTLPIEISAMPKHKLNMVRCILCVSFKLHIGFNLLSSYEQKRVSLRGGRTRSSAAYPVLYMSIHRWLVAMDPAIPCLIYKKYEGTQSISVYTYRRDAESMR